MACGLSNGHVTDDVTWPWKVKLVTPVRLKRNISKTTWARDFKFGMQLCMGMSSGRTKISPKSGRGLGHVTPTIFVSTVGYPSDSLASCITMLWKQLMIYLHVCYDTIPAHEIRTDNFRYWQIDKFHVLILHSASSFAMRSRDNNIVNTDIINIILI